MELFSNKRECFGCGACEAVCHQNAISMVFDEEGFAYPTVDSELCIGCGACKDICPRDKEEGLRPDKAIAFTVEEPGLSSSGGAFPALAKLFWKEHPNAPVWGAGVDEELNVVHRCITSSEELCLLQGSKYVQSGLSGVYAKILSQLKEGLHVMFTGTACQAAGIAAAAGEHRDKLFIVDLICNGAASPAVWKKYLCVRSEEAGSKVESFTFRNRKYFMGRGVLCTFENGSAEECSHPEDLFSVCYQRNLISRPSCYACPYTRYERVADITVGDFHGLDKVDPEFATNGASLVLARTEKGKEFASKLSAEGKYKEFTLEQSLQPRLESPAKEQPLRKLVLKDFIRAPRAVFKLKYGKILFASK